MTVAPDVSARGTCHNVNDLATVKLNWKGMLMMIQEYGTEHLDVCHPGWQDGTVVMCLWEVAHVFDPALFMGPEPPIETRFQLRSAL